MIFDFIWSIVNIFFFLKIKKENCFSFNINSIVDVVLVFINVLICFVLYFVEVLEIIFVGLKILIFKGVNMLLYFG